MTEQSTEQAISGSRRPRRLALVGAVAAALALVGGVAGGVAAMVSRSASPGSGSADATLFFPAVGPGPGAASPGAMLGQAAADGGAAMGVAQGGAGAPVPALAYTSQAHAVAGSGLAVYPSYRCASPPDAQLQADGITATGMVQVPLGAATGGSTTTLNVQVQSQNGSDVRSALADARARVAAIRDALHRAGVPLGDISEQNLNVWANGNPKGPGNSGVNDGLTVTIRDAALVDRAITAAADAGASNLNLWTSQGTSTATPGDDQVRAAVSKATAQAHSMATAVAQGAGLTLGKLHAAAVQAPAICPWAPGGPQLVVAVTVTYSAS